MWRQTKNDGERCNNLVKQLVHETTISNGVTTVETAEDRATIRLGNDKLTAYILVIFYV